ncbi:MAG: efflux RND transporter periplasmic adaptor subunit [Selenomonas sp.]|uniref:efflux RND transporter periplasmic adaptor subunit n=1 Tax=Selenomonas sp. TaxID=2053611 RepID=UPI0025DD38CA|nr:efflux RND transporter periplasmic adaptor subunit [Selenomonas sp.]MCR5440049.1 efflux RND transporter periplasmic adaptor subunit [Selenomonas sp.]
MKKYKLSFLACFLAVVCLLAVGCGSKDTKTVKAPLVKTQQVGSGSLNDSSSYSGTVRGRYETNMSFQVGGQILSRNVQVGSPVRAGDVLMVIDSRDVVQKANQGDAQVASARANLDLAQRNLARYSQLYQENAVAAATLDQYQASYDSAFASYQNALAQAAQGHNAMGYTNLTAGANGVVSAINAEEGQVVGAGQTVLTLVQTNELEIEINVPENRVADVAVGAPVTVNFWALHDRADGVVREVAPMADNAARTYRVRISVPKPPAGMQLGMTASVSFTPQISGGEGTADSTVLPLAAIYQNGDTPQVWVVGDDNTVSLKSVSVEDFGDNQVLVHGLNAADVVVTAGVHKLHEGQSVRTEADS